MTGSTNSKQYIKDKELVDDISSQESSNGGTQGYIADCSGSTSEEESPSSGSDDSKPIQATSKCTALGKRISNEKIHHSDVRVTNKEMGTEKTEALQDDPGTVTQCAIELNDTGIGEPSSRALQKLHFRDRMQDKGTNKSPVNDKATFSVAELKRIHHPSIDLSVVHKVSSLNDVWQREPPQYAVNTALTQPEPTSENYQQLMEAVKPFFQQTRTITSKMQQELHRSASEALSEQLSSFFTAKSGSTVERMLNKNLSRNDKGNKLTTVLTRTQRKHRAPPRKRNSEASTSSFSAQEKRVRIQDALNPRQVRKRAAFYPEQTKQANQGSESRTGEQKRTVTDVSGSSTGQNNSSTGSGGNSCANTANSSSGNDADDKSPSNEEAYEEGINDGSEGNASSNMNVHIEYNDDYDDDDRKPSPQWKGLLDTNIQYVNQEEDFEEKCISDNMDDHKRKLLDKKRKRIERRREYEAQQDFNFSEGDSDEKDHFFKPEKPITLDKVLNHSKIPRIVVQGAPFFLVVHTNAAYCRMTGTDSHDLVGKRLSELLALDNCAGSISDYDQQLQQGDNQPLASEDELQAVKMKAMSMYLSLEHLVATCGFGQVSNVKAKTNFGHQVDGKDVTVAISATTRSANVEGRISKDDNHSLTSTTDDGRDRQQIVCRVAIAPIVSTGTSSNRSIVAVGREYELAVKEYCQKYHRVDTSDEHKQNPSPHMQACFSDTVSENLYRKNHQQPFSLVTHFLIQVQPISVECDQSSQTLISSNIASVEAPMLVMSEGNVESQRDAVEDQPPLERDVEMEDEEESFSDATASTLKNPVAAIG